MNVRIRALLPPGLTLFPPLKDQMADRLKFRFVKIGNVAEIGDVAIDVFNPTDVEEIKAKLLARDFVEFLVYDREFEDEEWTFQPIPDEDDDTPKIS